MSAVEYAEYQRAIEWMERAEAKRQGKPVNRVRPDVARAIGISPGTIENIVRGRLKGLQGRVERAIDTALIRFLQRQHDGISHELAMAAARLERSDSRVVSKAVAARDALASLIDEAAQP